jgi:hypothetical protein
MQVYYIKAYQWINLDCVEQFDYQRDNSVDDLGVLTTSHTLTIKLIKGDDIVLNDPSEIKRFAIAVSAPDLVSAVR